MSRHRRRKHLRLSRIATVACVACVAALFCGPPLAIAVPGDVAGPVDIGDGRAIFVECRGSGSPTVVLMAGKGNGVDDWLQILAPDDPEHDAPGDNLPFGHGDLIHSSEAVLPATARLTRVCAYDRPDVRMVGGDISTPRAQPHSVDLDVDDLQDLLTALGEPAPYVLVAHPYSGLIADLYARMPPETVGGVVMVDAVSEQMAVVVSPAALANWDTTNATTSDQVREGVLLIDAFGRIAAAPGLPAVPAVVLSADKPWRTDLLPESARQDEQVTFADWLAAQDRLAAVLGAEHIARTHSGHDIYLYSPALVIEAIRDVVAQVTRVHG